MAYHTIGSLGAVAPVPLTPAEIGAQGGTAFDASTMTLYVGNGKIPVIPALLSAVIVKAVMFGGQKAGHYARSKIFKTATATNPPMKKLLPLALVAAGSVYLLMRNRSAPVDGLGAFSLSRAFKSVTNVGSVVKKVPLPSLKNLAPVRLVAPVRRLVGKSDGAAAPAPAPAPALKRTTGNAWGNAIQKVALQPVATPVQPQIQSTNSGWSRLFANIPPEQRRVMPMATVQEVLRRQLPHKA